MVRKAKDGRGKSGYERSGQERCAGFPAWEKLPLSNDFMFCRVMSDPAICAEMIRRLLHIPVGRVEQVQPQKGVRIHADARGVRFDVYVRDADRVYDVEIQVADEGNLPLRARYYQSALDLDMLKAGEAVGRLKESWIVFLCLFDPFRLGEAVYTVRKTFAEKEGTAYTDGTHTVFFNCRAHASAVDAGVRNILAYLACGEARDGFTAELERCVEQARGNAAWRREYMTLEMIKEEQRQIGIAIGEERGIAIGEERGIAIGEERRAEQAARNMLAEGFSAEDAARLSGLAVERVRGLACGQPDKD